MRKFVLGFILGALLFSAVTVYAAAELKVIPNPFPVFIDGVQTKVEGYNINGSTYLKLRDFEKFGLGVDFVDRQILITTKKETPSDNDLTDEKNVKDVDNVDEITRAKYNGYEAIIKDGITYVDHIILRRDPTYGLDYDQESGEIKFTLNNKTRVLSRNDYISYQGIVYFPLEVIEYFTKGAE